jgi:hypothetical protein
VVLYARKRSPRSGNLHTRKKTRETRGESVIKYSIWSRMASTLLGGVRRRATLPRRMRSEDGSSDAKNKELDEQKVVLALSAPWWRERSRPAGRPEPMCRVTRPRQVHVKGARASTIFERRSQQSAHPPRAVLAGL